MWVSEKYVPTYICGLRHRKIKAHACSFQNTRLDFKFWSRRRCKGAYIINIVPTNLSEQGIYYIVFYSSTIQFSYHLRLRYQALASWQRSTILPLALVLLHFSFCHLGAGTSSFQNLLIGLSSRAFQTDKKWCC